MFFIIAAMPPTAPAPRDAGLLVTDFAAEKDSHWPPAVGEDRDTPDDMVPNTFSFMPCWSDKDIPSIEPDIAPAI
jgi:hypothetical protein